MNRMASRWFAALLSLALLPWTVVPAAAQSSSSTGIIQITVRDAGADQALSDARVFLVGPTVASALTNKSGIVKYTDVPSGIYRVRVSKPNYMGVISKAFEVLGEKQVDVDVDLGIHQNAPSTASTATSTASNLQVIGTTRARVTVNVQDVDQNSAVRKISDSLTDALGTIAGVSVSQDSNDPNSPQTISLNGQDESQTAVTLDGIPLGAPGAATDLRKVNTDLFTGAGVSFGPQAGALAGSVNFRTLQPTQTWQSMFAVSDGSFDRYNYQIGETGSIGKLGIAALASKRAGNSPLTFQDYEDQSGLTYPHGGENANVGDYVKLRYGLTDNTTLLLTALQNNQSNSSLCTSYVTPLPCGTGPGNGQSGKFQFVYGTVQSLIGQTALSVTGYVNNNASFNDQLDRYIAPVGTGVPQLSPFASEQSTTARGIAASATISKNKHTFTLTGSTYAGITRFTPLVGGSNYVVNSYSATASRQLQLSDSYKVNDKLTLSPNVSYAGTTGAGSSLLAGLGAAWRPTRVDSYSVNLSAGSSVPANGLVQSYSDPNSARVNCYAGTAIVNGPGDRAQHQSALNYSASYEHQWGHGQVDVYAYHQTQSGQLINADLTANSLGLTGTPYFDQVAQYFGAACGANFGPPAVYVNTRIGDTTRVYEGYNITARIGIGRNVVLIPAFSTTVAEVTAADPAYTALDSTLVLGGQLPGRPLHSGNLTIDAFHPPSGFELLANAHYQGSNNNQYISPYVTLNAGISHQLGLGRLTLFESNMFNTESANFSTLQWAVPIGLSGGGVLYNAARPNAPRSITVTYSFNTGARPGAGYARPAGGGGATTAAAAANQQQRGGLGFGTLHFIPPPPGTDPLTVATSRTECVADLQPQAQALLAEIGTAAKAFAAGEPLPEFSDLTITPHGDRTGAWWFGLGPQIPQSVIDALQQRRAQQNPGGAAGGPRGGGPGGEFGGPGGPPGGFQGRIAVGPNENNGPRAQFSPPPGLIAAIQPFRALASCAYATVLTPAEAKAQGYDVPTPGVRPSPQPSATPAPGASPAPRGRFGGGNFLDYAPKIGIFVVRAPQLQTGGGSVKQ